MKKINYELVANDHASYGLLCHLINKYHPELRQARFALAWRKNRKPDVDGHLVLGECVLVNDLQKELVPFDFVIILNREVWENPEFTDAQKSALLDHELCHAAPKLNTDTDEQELDERGRPVWRIRKHDIEEFRDVVARHGVYKSSLELFAEALLKKVKEEKKKEKEEEEKEDKDYVS